MNFASFVYLLIPNIKYILSVGSQEGWKSLSHNSDSQNVGHRSILQDDYLKINLKRKKRKERYRLPLSALEESS